MSEPAPPTDLREQVRDAIRDPIMLFIEREFHMIATVESDKLADLLADAVLALIENGDVFETGRKMGADAERARLRERIEALRPLEAFDALWRDDVLALFEETP
jgi:hypothetical protein